mmetsp:Transcript_46262/g.116499  ORF Transcript_46262/g.116499 Transcript_46262/m.116499 type:complete len:113 (-) Transcript_46262:361-699(-)|eukprot:CAMPEP_0177681810 /NCGR_PEP_ID=MMETSP0447-20121125/30922_1 /TAXON_ID=0 /ORGANISM="Stygamoeba regulata, Strain BSH-02190019" /LENGTH=112 /DNA_ID=CAMNT_0019191267 /DNA_START=338 /DNA_END=676 /DNA_ORIENTATION=-
MASNDFYKDYKGKGYQGHEDFEPDKCTAWCCWSLGFILLCGLHRCYLRMYGTGFLWFITCGVLFIGQLVDACNMEELLQDSTDDFTTRSEAVSQKGVKGPVRGGHDATWTRD